MVSERIIWRQRQIMSMLKILLAKIEKLTMMDKVPLPRW